MRLLILPKIDIESFWVKKIINQYYGYELIKDMRIGRFVEIEVDYNRNTHYAILD